MEKRNLHREPGKKGGDLDVQLAGELRVGLAGGGFAQRGAMDDEPRWSCLKGGTDRVEVGKVELVAGQAHDLPIRREGGCGLNQVMADEPSGSGDPGDAALRVQAHGC